jgi:hypothetical protein
MTEKSECFLEEGFYEEEVVGDDDDDEYEVEDPLSARSSQTTRVPGGRLRMDNDTTDLPAVGSMVMNATNVQPVVHHQTQPLAVDDHTIVDPYPKPKHERCRCEARLYIHYHCAICTKPFALGCMLRHFQHLHYPPGTVRAVYSHLIDEERELFAVISYAQSTPNPAHVVKSANGKRCSNAVCKARRKEGHNEECEHCIAIDEDPCSPEPLMIHHDVLNNCHKDFVDSYRQYCNSAAQNGVPAVCVLKAPPHVTSHIIYSCYNENNNMKRYLVVQCEPTISCSCGVGAEKACWHRAIVSLCCQLPGQSETDSLEPPFPTLFTVREMQRFIDVSAIDRSDKSYFGSNSVRNKQSNSRMAGRPAKTYGGGRLVSPRDTPDLEHAQILSELMSGPAHFDDTSMIPRDRKSLLQNDNQQVLPIEYKSGSMALPAGEHIPDLLAAITRLNDTVELLRCEVTDLRAQMSSQKVMDGAKEVQDIETVVQGAYSPGGTFREWRGTLSPNKRTINDGVDSILEEVDFTEGVVTASQGVMGGGPPAKKQYKLIPLSGENSIPTSGSIIKVPMSRGILQGKTQQEANASSVAATINGSKYGSSFGIGLDGDIIDDSSSRSRGFTVNNTSDDDDESEEEEEYQMTFETPTAAPYGVDSRSSPRSSNSATSEIPKTNKVPKSPGRGGSGELMQSDNENMFSAAGRSLRSKASPSKTRPT